MSSNATGSAAAAAASNQQDQQAQQAPAAAGAAALPAPMPAPGGGGGAGSTMMDRGHAVPSRTNAVEGIGTATQEDGQQHHRPGDVERTHRDVFRAQYVPVVFSSVDSNKVREKAARASIDISPQQ